YSGIRHLAIGVRSWFVRGTIVWADGKWVPVNSGVSAAFIKNNIKSSYLDWRSKDASATLGERHL
ncbi:MAG: hypothetical protein ACYSU8_11690, partial [Planctomycetota bacterium]